MKSVLRFSPTWYLPVGLTALLASPAWTAEPSVLDQQVVGAKVLEIGDQKQLFVDDYVIAAKHGVSREAGQAKKFGVVLKPSLPTDFQTGIVHDGPDGGAGYEFGESCFCWFFSPHWDASKKMFRLWYMASKRPGSHLAYAESPDGVRWTKPLIAKDGKSNLVNWNSKLPILRDNESRELVDFGLDGVSVTIDPSLNWGQAERFKVGLFPNTLQVNVDASKGEIQVEVLNKEGVPIPGFSGKDAKKYRAADQLRLEPRWNDAADLSSLSGQVVRLRFRLKQANLYAFQVKSNGGAD